MHGNKDQEVDIVTNPPRQGWNAGFALVPVLLACLLSYGNIFTQQLVYDDRELIIENTLIHEFRPGDFFSSHYWSGTRASSNLYRPLVIASLSANYMAGGTDARGYKIVNFVLHVLCAWVVFLLGRRLDLNDAFSLLAALLFSVHPLHTEAVTSVVGRTELLWTLSALLALWFWMQRPLRPSPKPDHKPSQAAYGSALLFLLLALLSKESALLLPLLFWAADGWREARAAAQPLASALLAAMTWGLRRDYWGPGVVVLFYLLIRWRVLGMFGLGGGAAIPLLDNPLAHAGWYERSLTAFALVQRYVWQHFWPLGLSADYSYNQIPVATSFWGIGTLAGIAICLALGLAHVGRRPAFTQAALPLWVWLVPLIAASNLLTPVITIYAERLTYLPSAGFALAVAMGAAALVRLRRQTQLLGASLGVAVLVLLSFATYTRNRVWASDESFFRALVADAPRSARAHHNLGTLLLERGELEEAERELRSALGLYPGLAAAHVNLGQIAERREQIAQAEDAYREAIRLDPALAEAYNNLGKVLKETGRWEEAVVAYETALRAAPKHYRARFNLANTYAGLGRLDEAVAQYEQTIRQRPDHAPSYFNLGQALARMGRAAEARRAFEGFIRVWRGDAAQSEAAREMIRQLASQR